MTDPPFVLSQRDGPAAILRLNRPEKLNPLSLEMLAALCDALETQQLDPGVRVIVLTGGPKVFAAGADIRAMVDASPMDILRRDTRSYWQRLRRASKPLIAAVSGIAYGGGCELAMLCDLIVAAEDARFAQPEIKLGIIPGAGGTQRLARHIGYYRAMEMILTGEPLDAREAYLRGLVNRIVPSERCLDEAVELAHTIASRPPIAVRLAREALQHGFENTVREGLEVERRNFSLLFDTQDQKEGMSAFIEKRSPDFKGE